MPLCLDSYSQCSFRCLYCFAYYQKAFNASCSEEYLSGETKAFDVKKIKDLFLGNVTNKKDKWLYENFIKKRRPIQMGGMADPFDEHEAKYGVGIELFELLAEMKYPISFSTKGTLCATEKYMKIWRKSPETFHFKFSIISMDVEKCKIIEALVEPPLARLAAMKKLSDIGCPTTLRMRPFMIGLTDKTFPELFEKAKEAGAISVSTEFFCLDTRGDEKLKSRYATMSELLGYDLWDYYRANSTQSGYMRLNREIKKPFVIAMKKKCDELGLQFHVSGPDFKELGTTGSCCGLPKDNIHFQNYCKGQWTQTIVDARLNPDKEITWKDLPELKWEEGIAYGDPFNLDKKQYRIMKNMTLLDARRNYWNNTKAGKGVAKYFNGKLEPTRVDENGDVVYKYKKEEDDL